MGRSRQGSDVQPSPISVREIKEEIEQRMYGKDDPNSKHKFITEERLREVWPSNNQRLGFFLGSEQHSIDELTHAREKFLLVLSILVYIGIDDHSIQQVFCSRFIEQGYDDSRLPFSKTTIAGLFEDRPPDAEGSVAEWYRYEGAFFEDQFLFNPTKIVDTGKTTEAITIIDPLSRWPFSQPEKQIASGAFGDVYHARVVKKYLTKYIADGELDNNAEDRDVAFKKFRSKGDGWKELKNLDYLKESIITCDRMTIHFAAIIKGEEFYLFLPYTRLGDLEVFLQEGVYFSYQTNTAHVRRYDFHEEFESNGAVTSLDLFKELGNLARGLEFLHRSLFDKGLEIYCAHRDFRPHNILVFPGGPVGLWKITDFGISSFDHATHDHDSSKPSMGDVIRNRLSDGSRIGASSSTSAPAPGPGAHRAPELSDEASSKRPTPNSDVWSLGCVASDVLAFAHGRHEEVGGSVAVNHARKSRTSLYSDNDSFFEPVPQSHDSQPTAKFTVKTSILKWLSDVAKTDPHDKFRFRSCVAIIHCALQVEPQKRADAHWMSSKLLELERKNIFAVKELRDVEDRLRAAVCPPPISDSLPEVPSRPDTSDSGLASGVASSRTSSRDTRHLEREVTADQSSGSLADRMSTATTSYSDRHSAGESGLERATLAHGTRSEDSFSMPQELPSEHKEPPLGSEDAFVVHPLSLSILIEDVTVNAENLVQSSVSRSTTNESGRSTFSRMSNPFGRVRSENKQKVTDFAISHCGGHISFVMALGKQSGIRIQTLEVYQIGEVQTSDQTLQMTLVFSRQLPDMPQEVEWFKPRTAGEYVSVMGKTKGARQFAMYDMLQGPDPSLNLDLSGYSLNEVLPSPKGLFVFWGLKTVLLWNSCSSAQPSCIHTPNSNDGLVSHVAFGLEGAYLYLWATESFSIWATVADTPFSKKKRFKVERNLGRSERDILLPCGVLSGCLFRTNNGIWQSAQAAATDIGPRMEMPTVSTIDSSACAADANMFVYVTDGEKGLIKVQYILLDSKGKSGIKFSPHGPKDLWEGTMQDPKIGLRHAIRDGERQLEVVLCNKAKEMRFLRFGKPSS